MAEIPRAEMQKEHYQALKNPMYVLDGMFDVLREELSVQAPYSTSDREIQVIYKGDIEWTPRQWDAVNQLKAQVLYLQKNVNTLKEIKTKKSNRSKYRMGGEG